LNDNAHRHKSAIKEKYDLKAAQQYPSMKIRILLALGTGLRRGDVNFSLCFSVSSVADFFAFFY
jgi:hypothetical protein